MSFPGSIYRYVLATVCRFEGSKYTTDDDNTKLLIERYKNQFDPELGIPLEDAA